MSNQLRHINTVDGGSRDVTTQKRKVHDRKRKIEIITLIIQLSGKPSVLVDQVVSNDREDLGLPIGIIILIVVVVFVVLFVIVDVTCYFRNKCGVIMCLKERVGHAGSADTRSKEPIMESGESEKGTLPIGGVQNKDGHLVEDEKKVPLLDSEGGAKDEVEEENEVAVKEAVEMEPEDKQPDAAENKPVAEGEEARDEPAPELTPDPIPPPQVATTPPASDGPAELSVATEPSA